MNFRDLAEVFSQSLIWAVDLSALYRLVSTTAASKQSTLGRSINKVAVIPVQGLLTNGDQSWWGTSYKFISEAAEQAAADKSVKRIVLAVDSPGGDVVGLPEAATVLSQVAKVKPVTAMVDGTAASAAYWLASQAHDITLTPSGEVGSVGVRMMHVDISQMLANDGIKVTEIFSGDHKTAFSPYKPLSEETIARAQNELGMIHNGFLQAVTAGRGNRVSADMRRSRFGEGRLFKAGEAARGGLVDNVQAARDFYRFITPVEEKHDTVRPISSHAARLTVAKARRP